MNDKDSQNDDLSHDSGEPQELDELLRMAKWPEPTPAALERLKRHWRQISTAALGRRRRWKIVAAAAAAVLLAAGGLQLLRLRSAGEPPQMVDRQAAPDKIPDDRVIEKRDDDLVPDDGAETPEKSEASEKPEPKKRDIRRRRTRREWIARAKELDRQLQEALDLLAGEGIATAEVAETLRDEQAFFVRRLSTFVASSEGEQQVDALDLLEELSGDAANVLLMQLVSQPKCHAVVVRRLVSRVDSATLRNWIAAEQDSDLQKELLTEMVRRSDRQSLTLYLQLVALKQTRRPALEALQELPEPPSEQLLAYLRSPDQNLRWAAVLALAEATDPRVVDPLIGMVTSNYHRQEALMSLMRRKDARSMQFIHQVARHEAFAGAVLSARNRLRFLIN